MQVLEFETKKEMTLEMWTDRQEKIQAFFGPGVLADIKQTGQVSSALLHHLRKKEKSTPLGDHNGSP